MIIEIKMPKLGQNIDELKLLKWCIKVGDIINKGDILCEVETDKVNIGVESFESGKVLELYAKPDTFISTGETIAILEKKDKSY